MSNYPVSKTSIGLAKEITRHTPVTTPAFWAKVMAPKYKPSLTILDDNTLQGSMVQVYDGVPGLRHDSHGWNTFPYGDVLPLYVLAELGSTDTVQAAPGSTTLSSPASAGASTISVGATIAAHSWIVINKGGATQETHFTTAVSGTSAPYTVTLDFPLNYAQLTAATVGPLTAHQFSLLNNTSDCQPPSLTISDYDGEEWRELAGAQLDKFDLKLSPNKLAELSVNFFADASISPTTPVPSFSAAQAEPGWTLNCAIGGTQLNYVEDVQISLSRGVKPIEAFTGTQAYYNYFAGPLQATAKITVIEQSAAPEITKYLSGSKQSFNITFSDHQDGYGARFFSTNAIFKTAELVRGKEWVEATIDVQLLPSATDATAGGVSPINVNVGNAQTTAY